MCSSKLSASFQTRLIQGYLFYFEIGKLWRDQVTCVVKPRRYIIYVLIREPSMLTQDFYQGYLHFARPSKLRHFIFPQCRLPEPVGENDQILKYFQVHMSKDLCHLLHLSPKLYSKTLNHCVNHHPAKILV